MHPHARIQSERQRGAPRRTSAASLPAPVVPLQTGVFVQHILTSCRACRWRRITVRRRSSCPRPETRRERHDECCRRPCAHRRPQPLLMTLLHPQLPSRTPNYSPCSVPPQGQAAASATTAPHNLDTPPHRRLVTPVRAASGDKHKVRHAIHHVTSSMAATHRSPLRHPTRPRTSSLTARTVALCNRCTFAVRL